MNQLFLKNVKYLISAPSKKYWPESKNREICIVGRSNVGKSTLINKITNNNSMAKVSSVPGYTKYLNFFDVNNTYMLVDSPGYGYAKVNYTRDEQFENMMTEYIHQRENLVCIIMLVDCKIGFNSNDLLLLEFLKNSNVNIQIVATKLDKVNQSGKSLFIKQAKEVLNEIDFANMILYSSLDNRTYNQVVERIQTIYNG